VLQDLVDQGNSVIVIEHNLDVIKCADWILDLGPEGGAAGGELIAVGTPEEVAAVAESHTGRHLSRLVTAGRARPARVRAPAKAKAPAKKKAKAKKRAPTRKKAAASKKAPAKKKAAAKKRAPAKKKAPAKKRAAARKKAAS
jgi:excinuclease ABC subunit A